MPHKDLTARRTYLAARYQRMREGLKAKDAADKAAWIAAGLCSRCGESPPLAGRRYCESCRAKRLAETKRNQRRRMAKNPNTCSTCTLRPATRGRLCMQCYHHAHSKRQTYKQRCADARCFCC